MLVNYWTWVDKDISKSRCFPNEHKLIEQVQNFEPKGGKTYSHDSRWSVLMTPIHQALVFLATVAKVKHSIQLISIQLISSIRQQSG